MAQIPAALLREELRRREQRASALVRRYERLMERAAALRAEIEASGGAILESSVARVRNETNLVEALAKALAGKTISVDEAEIRDRPGFPCRRGTSSSGLSEGRRSVILTV